MGKKKKNTHKFVSFTERISKLRIDVVHRIEKRTETPDESETFFQQCLSKWSELNCSLDFQDFNKEVFPLVKSFSLLVYHQKTVVEILQRYLKKKETLALDALFELCVELSRDLQGDFSAYFTDFLHIIAAHLHTNDAEKVEDCFKTLAYLFKFQWRFLAKDMKAVYRSYSPLLSDDQASHIHLFAAESFAFLMRKAKDLSGLVDEIFLNVVEKPQLCSGIGRLFAETVRGVRNQFHSCTESVLTTLLDKLKPEHSFKNKNTTDACGNRIFEVFVCMFMEMAKYTTKEHTKVVWDNLETRMNSILSHDHSDNASADDLLSLLVQLTDVWTEWKTGTLIFNPVQLYKMISTLMNRKLSSECLKSSLLKLASSLLLANCPELKEGYERNLIHEVFTCKSFLILDICQFTRYLKNGCSPVFRNNLISNLISYFETKLSNSLLNSEEVNEILFMLAEIVVQQVSFERGFDACATDDVTTFSFVKLAGKKGQAWWKVLFKLESFSESAMPNIWASLVCLPFVRPFDVESVSKSVVKLFSKLCAVETKSLSEKTQVLFLLSQAVKCVSLLWKFQNGSLEQTLPFEMLLDLLRENQCDIHVLQACHIYLSVIKQQNSNSSILSSQNLLLVYSCLEKNLSSHAHLVRLITLKILTLFEQLNMDNSENSSDMENVNCGIFEDCLEAELVPMTFQDYRQKLIVLQKLTYPNTRRLPDAIKDAPLRYLIGILYVNLSTMWDPVMSIITTYSVDENKKSFWNVFNEYLVQASSDTADKVETETIVPKLSSANSLSTFFQERVTLCVGAREDNRVDYQNFRLLLWKSMAKFPQVAEPRSRQVVPLFLEFVRKECSLIDESSKVSYQDLTKPDDVVTKFDHMDITNKDDNGKATRNLRKQPAARPMRMKTLSAGLTLFSLFKNPQRLFQETLMKELYLALLTHKDSDIQKLGLACLMTYKLTYLTPYKENLERLLEDKTFKDELMNFSSNEDLNIVSEDHHGDLMQLLIRVLYGKMQRWTGTGTGGKAGSSSRRSLVLRFLNSCHGDEMKVFIELISQAFKEIFDNDDQSLTNHPLTQVVPLRKQLGFLNMLSQIIEMLGSRAEHYLPRLLQILFYCLTISKDALQQKERVQPKYLSNLKAVRQFGMKCLTKLFDAFPQYDFSLISENCFELAVWPQIAKLHSESLQSPTPLLRLVNAWSKNPRFFPLLSRVPPGSSEGLLANVVACLSSDHVQPAVVTMVMEIADRLLEGGGPESDCDEESDLMHLGCESSSDVASLDRHISYGARLVIVHVNTLLVYLSKSVKRTSKDLAKAKGKLSNISTVSKLELTVLSKISPFIIDAEHSLVLVRLMIPILNASRKADAQIGMLKSIANLLKNVETPSMFLAPLSRLFSTLQHRGARTELCRVFSSISEKDPTFALQARLVYAMNSWNKKQLDEPDFGARLDAFSEAGKLVKEGSVGAEIISPFLFNATYFAMRTEDLALRYGAGGFIRAVVDKVCEDESGKWFDLLVLGSLLPAVREAVKSKQEGARNEFVLVLGSLVKRFDHESLVDMKPLTSDDPEVDFFENIVHIQVHRRIRALRKFSSTCEETSFSAGTLSSFIRPLVTHFVYEYKSAKDHNVVTEAINAISAISRQLSWPKYANLLRHYLRMLPREKEIQKVIVRIVVAILESFHFDLTDIPDNDMEDGSRDASTKIEETKENAIECAHEDDDEMENKDKNEKTEECPLKLKLKIHETITTNILPQLHKCLTKKIDSTDFHRLSGRKENDEDEILRVPIVLAMVKLLQSLPKKTLQSNLPGLLIRVCQALKSRAFDVRETARGTLSKITNSLGVYYFPFILNELRSSLTRGYQLHVLGSTLHYLLTNFKEHVPDGGLDVCVKSIVEMLVDDLFGEQSREREVNKIATKLPEARSTKSFESFEIVAKNISSNKLLDVITPLKEVLDETQSHKTSQRVEEILRRVSVNLQKNPLFSPEQMLLFVHGLINERLPLVEKNNRAAEEDTKDKDPRLRSSDTFIIPSNPLRGGKAPGISHKTNAHVLITFGLQLLLTALKREKLTSSDEKHVQMLDPFVAVLKDALLSKHVKITTLALRCLGLVVKFPLPSLKLHVLQIASQLFKLLKLHARTGAASGDNYEMVLSAFKTITVLIRDFTELKVTDRQLQILLTFVEEDIHDYTRQSSAFPLLKAILSRKLQVAEINDVMLKVAELSVTENSSSVRLQCRQVLLQFLLDYPLGKKRRRFLEFFISQLEYEHASGRESTLEMIITIITSFPEKVVFDNSGLFFLPLCTRLVNDESTNCRKLTAVTIKTLLKKLDVERRDHLFAIVLTWMNEEKISLQRLSCHVCGLFVEVEGQSFDRRLKDVFPLLFDIIKPENYNVKTDEDHMDEVRQQETLMDHLLINALTTLIKIIQECSVLKGGKKQITNEVWDSILSHLLFPHTWVRVMASRLFGLLFSTLTPEELINLSKDSDTQEYVAIDLEKKAFLLCEALTDQLKERSLDNELGEQAVKNLLYLSKVILLLNKEIVDNPNESRRRTHGQLRHSDGAVSVSEERDARSGDEITLTWLLTKMCNIAKYEASQTPKLNQKRLCVLRWVAAVGSHLGCEQVLPYLIQMLKPVYRELDGGSTYTDEQVRNLSQEVAELFKNLVGRETFSHAYSNAKQSASETKEKRKMQTAFEAVAHPQASVAKKIKRNIAKKESRKRKFEAKKTPRRMKKSKVNEH